MPRRELSPSMAALSTIAIALLLSFLLQAGAKPATTSFDFPGFSPLPNSISFQGEGFVDGVSLELHRNASNSFGRALYTIPVQIWDSKTGNVASFSTRFSFSVFRNPNHTYYADGLAFFLAPVGYGVPLNTTGGGLTVFNRVNVNVTLDAKVPVVAVEFDTFQNSFDTDVPHVGIDVGIIASVHVLPWDPFAGRDNFTGAAEISYDPANTRLRARFTQENGNNVELAYALNLRDHLPESVTIGIGGSTGAVFERHVIHSWSFNSSLELGNNVEEGRGKKSSIAVVAGGIAGAVVLIIVAVVLVWFLVRRRKAGAATGYGRGTDNDIDEKELDGGKGPKSFSYSELVRATRNFAPEEKLGRGGFGDVYKGILRNPETVVAIKRVARDSHQGPKEFVAEVKVISRVRHRNLVKLVGWCHERGELLLVYEFMPNGSLDTHLYGDRKSLPWPTRYNIAKGVAAALLYLHEEWEQCVVHRDVKASNVMLDSNFNAKLGDFGLARLVDHGSGMETTAVAGTMGYLAPETATNGRASTESDVYSFGVLALEIACGRKPIEILKSGERVSLVEFVWDFYGKGSILEAADPKLNGEFDKREMERLMVVGLWCVHPSYQERPTMAQVIGVLVFDMALPTLPSQLPMLSFGGVSLSGIGLSSMKGWSSSSASGLSAGFTTGSSVNSGASTSSRPLLKLEGI